MNIPGKQLLKDLTYTTLKSILSTKDFDYFIAFYRFSSKYGFKCMVERNPGLLDFASRFMLYTIHEGDEKVRVKLELLKQDLDDESISSAERMYQSYLFIYQNNLIPADRWFGSLDKKDELEIGRKLRSISDTVKIPKELSAHNSPDIFYFNSGLHFVPKSVKEQCINNKDILDCGAYIGDTAIVFSKLYNPKRVFSFEPVSSSYAKLLTTIRYSELENVIPVKKAVGEKSAKVKIVPDGYGSFIDGARNEGEEIEVIDIDRFVSENKVNPGVIKMDVEGYELKAVIGALDTIKKFRPIVLIALYHRPEDFFEIKPLLEKHVKGYRFMIRQLITFNPVSETFLIGYPAD